MTRFHRARTWLSPMTSRDFTVYLLRLLGHTKVAESRDQQQFSSNLSTAIGTIRRSSHEHLKIQPPLLLSREQSLDGLTDFAIEWRSQKQVLANCEHQNFKHVVNHAASYLHPVSLILIEVDVFQRVRRGCSLHLLSA